MLIYKDTGGGTSPMRSMKAIMAIAAICATMMTMRVVMRSKKNNGKRKSRGMRRSR